MLRGKFRNQGKFAKAKYFDICFCVCFVSQFQTLISKGITGH